MEITAKKIEGINPTQSSTGDWIMLGVVIITVLFS